MYVRIYVRVYVRVCMYVRVCAHFSKLRSLANKYAT